MAVRKLKVELEVLGKGKAEGVAKIAAYSQQLSVKIHR